MDFAPLYLIERFFYRFGNFFHHWYADGSRAIAHYFISSLETADETFAVKITLRYFFHPLYRDYSVIGRILGVIFRSARIAIGLFFYAIIALIFLLIYLAWLAIPAIVIFYAAKNI